MRHGHLHRVLYDNYPFQEGLKTDHGFSCLIKGTEKTVLFDTGADAETLFYNLAALKIEPADVDLVVISHIHGDPMGGSYLPGQEGDARYSCRRQPPGMVKDIEAAKGKVVPVKDPLSVCEGVFSTGTVGRSRPWSSIRPEGW